MVGPEGAVREEDISVGEIHKGSAAKNIEFFMGDLKPGSMRTTTIQTELEKYIEKEKLAIIDCPPGTSCSMVTSVRNSDYCILVTEPTPFGLNDLMLSVDVVRSLGLPFGVIVNREGIGNNCVDDYCKENKIKILTRIRNDIEIAKIISRGGSIIDYFPAIKEQMISMVKEIENILKENKS